MQQGRCTVGGGPGGVRHDRLAIDLQLKLARCQRRSQDTDGVGRTYRIAIPQTLARFYIEERDCRQPRQVQDQLDGIVETPILRVRLPFCPPKMKIFHEPF